MSTKKELGLVRTSICTVCRLRMSQGDTCHNVLDTLSARGRAALTKKFRRDPIRISRYESSVGWFSRVALKLTGYGIHAAFGYALALFKGTPPAFTMGIVTLAFIPFVVMVQNFFDIETLVPRGILTRVFQVSLGAQLRSKALLAAGITGVAEGQMQSVSPGAGKTCLAYMTELHHKRAKPTTLILRDGYTSGFEIITSEGSIAIAAGVIQIISPPEVIPDVDKLEFKRRLHPLNIEFLHFDRVHERILEDSAQVILRNEVEIKVSQAAENMGYRELPQVTTYTPIGVPIIEIMSETD